MPNKYKIVVFVPETHAEIVRQAIGEAGAGRIGNYTFCSFSVKGYGVFKPEVGAHPAIGIVGKLEYVKEERIEVTVDTIDVDATIKAIKCVHPYEEIVIDVYSMEDIGCHSNKE